MTVQFCRRSFQGAYVFSVRLHCPVVGEFIKEVQVFADRKDEARRMARAMLLEMQAKIKKE